MRFFDRFTKRKLSFDAAGRHIAAIAMTYVDPFLEVTLPEIADCLDIDLDTFNINALRSNTMIVCLWATTKALENDDYRLLDAYHHRFFTAIGIDRRSQLVEIYRYRCTRYNKTWDKRSHWILAYDILCDMCNEGELDKDLLDPFASMLVIKPLVMDTMTEVLKARKEIILPDT